MREHIGRYIPCALSSTRYVMLTCSAIRDHYYCYCNVDTPACSLLSVPGCLDDVCYLLFSFILYYIVMITLYFFSTGFNCFYIPVADDSFQIQDWLRSNGNHDRSYQEFDYHHRIRPLSPVKRHRISTTDGRGPDRRRQLKSMESLLGLSDENLNGKFLVRDIKYFLGGISLKKISNCKNL